MAILTMKGHVSRALDFLNKDSIYAAIGKSTKWAQGDCKELEGDGFDPTKDYDLYPPAPSINDNMIDIIGFKKIEIRSMVIQDDEGSIEYRGTRWRSLGVEEAIEVGSRWVYISTVLTYNELPVSAPYRQVGIYTGLKTLESVPDGKYALLPEDVEDVGLLEILDNRKPVYRDYDVRELIKIILEF